MPRRPARPLEGNGGGHFFHGSDGFPSGHTMGSFALASVVAHGSHDNKAIVFLAYGLATMVGHRASRPATFRLGYCGGRSHGLVHGWHVESGAGWAVDRWLRDCSCLK